MTILAFIHSYRWTTVTFLVLYAIVVTLPHQSVQDWLAVTLVASWGLAAFYVVMAALALTGLSAAALICVRRLPQHGARGALRAYAALTLALVLVAWRFLSVNNSELVHFPQYAVAGFVLMTLTLSVTDTLSWVTLMGGVDEAYQYAVIHPTWGNPYDFNDVVLDFIGGAIGALLACLWLRATPRGAEGWKWTQRPGLLLLGLVVTTGAMMLLTNQAVFYEDKQRSDYWFALSRQQPQGFWFFDATWGPRVIHGLAPWEGPVVLLGLLWVYSRLDRRCAFRLPS